jgi:L-alanine-DL-glutamate epimerase-like enolase superfamily enzyme
MVVGMIIDEVEIHEFVYRLENVGTRDGHQVYERGNMLEQPGFVLTIRTDTGIEGHYRGFMQVPPMVTQIEMATPEFLIGADPLERERIWQQLWQAFRHTDHLGMGPIDIALWDLAGTYYEESISTLLGGYRERIPAYASTAHPDEEPDGLDSAEAYADYAEACLEDGYSGFKIHPWGDSQKDIELCRAVADRVGDRMDLMLDPASEYETYTDAIRVGTVLDELGFYWYEDPLADTGQSGYSTGKLADELSTPILGCEHVRSGPFGRADHLRSGWLDLVRGDAHLDGGITGVMKIARLAEAFGIDVELHVGGPAHLHCLSAIRNNTYHEHGLLHPEFDWMTERGFDGDVERLEDGSVGVPSGPGLGVEIDWGYVRENQTEHTVIDQAGTSGLN